METLPYLSNRFNEMVFQERNKNYGAYSIRRSYDRTMFLAISIAIASLLLFSFGSRFAGVAIASNDDRDSVSVHVITLPPDLPKPREANKPKPKQEKNEVLKGPKQDQNTTPVVAANLKQDTSHRVPGPAKRPDGVDSLTGPPGDPTQPIVKADTTASTGTVTDANGCDDPPTCPSLLSFLRSNINYPVYCKDNGIQGTVWLEFIVDTDGTPKDVKVLRGVHRLLDNEALRVAARMPKWTPCSVSGSKMRARYLLPVRFTLK